MIQRGYVYFSEDGLRLCRWIAQGKPVPAKVTVRGKEYHYAGGSGEKHRKASRWPLTCDAIGVMPSQIPEAYAEAERHGVRDCVTFNGDGDPVFETREKRKRYCEALGFYDRNAGYGDPQPR